LLATIALAVGTSFIINSGKNKYAWFTLIPMLFVGITTLTACWLNITNIYAPQINIGATRLTGIINLSLTLIIMICAVTIIFNAVPKWLKAYRKTID
jgi:carbon starvation protein